MRGRCDNCGDICYKEKHAIEDNDNIFCDMDCYAEYRNGQYSKYDRRNLIIALIISDQPINSKKIYDSIDQNRQTIYNDLRDMRDKSFLKFKNKHNKGVVYYLADYMNRNFNLDVDKPE